MNLCELLTDGYYGRPCRMLDFCPNWELRYLFDTLRYLATPTSKSFDNVILDPVGLPCILDLGGLVARYSYK